MVSSPLYPKPLSTAKGVISAITIAPLRCRLGLSFQIYDHNVRWKEVADFLKMLHRHLRRKFIVVMDRFNAHRKAVRVLQAHWFEVEWLLSLCA
jgi:hypothetical protein